MATCSFCGNELKEGRGTRLFRRDGSMLNFCTRKCEVNLRVLKRTPTEYKWTKKYASTAKKKGKGESKEAKHVVKAPDKK
ncbi:50S ribosomal protein L24 [Candidatus Micrarchaeota archaeon]|nr:50S ribosomal protein L24 [Candidatus Micrarchaeota archaeon]